MTVEPLFCPSCGEQADRDAVTCRYCGQFFDPLVADKIEPIGSSDYVYEEIGAWSQIKHEIIVKYLSAYMTIMARQTSIRRVVYVDGFAGTGFAIDRNSGDLVLGSAARAILVQPPFDELHLIERDPIRVKSLQKHVDEIADSRVTVHPGDCVEMLRTRVLPRCRWEDRARAVCLLDPYGVSVPWSLLEEIGQMKSVEIFFNFMIVGMNRNVLWRDFARVSENRKKIIDRVWGDRTWEDAFYTKERTLFDTDVSVKNSNESVADAFRERLRTKAGFGFVPRPIPVRNDSGATLYYLFFASPNKTAGHIVDDIFGKYRR